MTIIYRITILLFLVDIIGRKLWLDFFVNHNGLVWIWLVTLSFLLSFCFTQSMIFMFRSSENVKSTESYFACFTLMLCVSILFPAAVALGLLKVSETLDENLTVDFPYIEALKNARTLEDKETIASLVYRESGVAISYMATPEDLLVYSPTEQELEKRKSSLQLKRDMAIVKNKIQVQANDNILLLLVKLIIFFGVTLAVTLYHHKKLTNQASGTASPTAPS